MPKGMAVRLTNFSNLNGYWLLDEPMLDKLKTIPDQLVKCDDKFFIGATNCEELKEDCKTNIDIYDCSVIPEIMIGKLIYFIAINGAVSYDWIPVSADYVTQLTDFYNPPAILRLIKVPK
jgi:hypothetical protein